MHHKIEILNEDSLPDLLRKCGRENYDSVITDPPYDLETMIKRKTHLPYNIKEIFENSCSGNVVAFCQPEKQYFQSDEYHFWVKPQSTKNTSKSCSRIVEMALVLRRGDIFNQIHWHSMSNVHNDRILEKIIHPHQKPISLIERLVRIYTNKNDRVYDPFSGSGSFAIACFLQGRNYFGKEISELNFRSSVKRIMKFLEKINYNMANVSVSEKKLIVN